MLPFKIFIENVPSLLNIQDKLDDLRVRIQILKQYISRLIKPTFSWLLF